MSKATLDFGEGETLVLPTSLASLLKKLGSEEFISWFPSFVLETVIDGIKYQVLSTADDSSDESSNDEDHDDSDDGGMVIVICGDDEPVEYGYDHFWDVVDDVHVDKVHRLTNFKFHDTTSNLSVTKKKPRRNREGKSVQSKTMISAESGFVRDLKVKGEVKEEEVPLFECELTQFADIHGGDGLKLLSRVFH